MSQFKNKVKGFTIIEATVAIAILMVGVVSVSQFFPFGLKIIGDSRHKTIAANIGMSKIEQIQAQNYDNIAVGIIEPKQRVNLDQNSYFYNYQRQTEIEFVDENFNDSVTDVGLKKIVVTVYWTNAIGNTEKNTQFISLKADY